MLIVYVSFVKTLILIKFQFQFRISWKTSMSWWGRLRIWEPKFLYDSTLKNVWKANNHLPKNISRLGPIPFTSGIKFSSSHGSSPSPEGLCTWQSDSKFQWVGILSNTGWCLIKPRRFWMMPRVKPNGVRAAKPKKKSSLSTDSSTLHHHWLTSVPLQLFPNVRQKRQISQFQSRMSHFQKMFDHKSAEMARW